MIVNAGTSIPSSSRMLADRITQKTVSRLVEDGVNATIEATDPGPVLPDGAVPCSSVGVGDHCHRSDKRLTALLQNAIEDRLQLTGERHVVFGAIHRHLDDIDVVGRHASLARGAAGAGAHIDDVRDRRAAQVIHDGAVVLGSSSTEAIS